MISFRRENPCKYANKGAQTYNPKICETREIAKMQIRALIAAGMTPPAVLYVVDAESVVGVFGLEMYRLEARLILCHCRTDWSNNSCTYFEDGLQQALR
jgi:hypothetical protein